MADPHFGLLARLLSLICLSGTHRPFSCPSALLPACLVYFSVGRLTRYHLNLI